MYNVIGMWKIRKGFTLVELLMVIALVGVLSVSTAVISIGSNIKKGNDGKRKGDLESLRSAIEVYYSEKATYPASTAALTTTYIGSIPADPKSGQSYYYLPSPSSCGPAPAAGGKCTTYVLCAAMEGTVTSPITVPASCAANCGATCNYAIANP